MRHRFQIHLVTDRKRARGELARVVGAALRGGVDWAQLREKSGPALGLYEDAMRIIPEAHRLGARVSINDRADVALATGAGGVNDASKYASITRLVPSYDTGSLLSLIGWPAHHDPSPHLAHNLCTTRTSSYASVTVL